MNTSLKHKLTISLNYLRPDISKGITTLRTNWRRVFASTIIYDLTYQKGLRQENSCGYRLGKAFRILSTTWHIKRDYDTSTWVAPACPPCLPYIIYDLTYQKGLRLFWVFLRSPADSFIIYDLTYQKGLRQLEKVFHFLASVIRLSTTWHIKRDYDFMAPRNHSMPLFIIIYDLTYQKGLRLMFQSTQAARPA